jgi:signal peptidase I
MSHINDVFIFIQQITEGQSINDHLWGGVFLANLPIPFYTLMEKNSTQDFVLTRFLIDIVIDVVIVVVMVLIIRNFFFAPFRVHGPSMCDTFNVYNGECYNGDGEFILVSKLSRWDLFGWSPSTLERGDVVVFQAPYSEEGEYYIKRIIGLPGDTIKVENGYVYIKNESGIFELLSEPYLNDENRGHTYPYGSSSETYTVPEHEYLVFGDNRTKSSDERRCYHQTG